MSKFVKFYPPILRRKTGFEKSYKNKDASFLNTRVIFGDYGIRLCEKIYLRPKQVQSVLFFIRKKIKGIGEVRFKSFPLKRITKKGNGMRMGRGKGKPSVFWFFCGRAGAVFLEVACSYLDLNSFIELVFLKFQQMFRTKIRLLASIDEKKLKKDLYKVK